MQHSLKIEVEGLKTQTVELKKSLAEKTDEVEKSEAAFRSEVSLPVSGGSAPNLSSKQHKMGLVRYRSLRDHNGRFYLVVKIWWLLSYMPSSFLFPLFYHLNPFYLHQEGALPPLHPPSPPLYSIFPITRSTLLYKFQSLRDLMYNLSYFRTKKNTKSLMTNPSSFLL